MSSFRRFAFPLFALLMLLLPALPVPDFWITQSNYIGLYSLVALGLVLLTGVAGLASYPLALAGALGVGLLESFGSFWASSFKEVIVFTIILPVLLWRSLRSGHSDEEH